MKKLVAIVVTVAMALGILLNGTCYAGDEGWAAAGGFLGGLIVGSALSDHSGSYYYYGSPVYYSRYPVYSYPVYSTHGYRTYRHHHHHHYRTRCTTCYPHYYYYDYRY